MNRPIALVDFDGVVVKNTNAKDFVKGRIHRYMKKCLPPVLNFNDKLVEEFNKELYESFGHTHLGLEKFYLGNSFQEFNQEVYKDIPYTLYLTEQEKSNWDTFYKNMKKHGIPIYIFTNAPKEWVERFLNPKDYLYYYAVDYIGHMDHCVYDMDLIKPEPMVFKLIQRYAGKRPIIYYDDKLINFQHTLHNQNWTHVWVTEKSLYKENVLSNLHAVPSLAYHSSNLQLD